MSENSGFVRNTWRFHSPYWWGLADVIGFIDTRASIATQSPTATLFLTTKRPSKRLVDKRYVSRHQEAVPFDNASTNETLRASLSAAVGQPAADPAHGDGIRIAKGGHAFWSTRISSAYCALKCKMSWHHCHRPALSNKRMQLAGASDLRNVR